MTDAHFSVAVFPFLKTSAPVRLGSHTFRCTTDLEGLPPAQAKAVSEIAAMLFLRDDLRITRASYAIVPPLGSFRPGQVVEDLARLRAVVAYLYSAPHHTFDDVFLSPETVSLAVLSPGPVDVFLVGEHEGTTLVSSGPPPEPNARNETTGYEGVYNTHEPLWLVAGSRLYGPKRQMTLNISQDLARDLGAPEGLNRNLLFDLLRRPGTPIGERVFTALEWYNRANADYGDPNQTVLNLAVAFETLLRVPSSEKTDRLVDAISLLLGRTERLDDWAAQFYAARSEVAHEGRVRDWWFYAAGRNKSGREGHPFGSLKTYGRQIFQLCVATIQVGADLAEQAGLKERLVANSERYAAISEALAQSSQTPAERLLEIAPLVEGLRRFRFVASGGLTVAAVIGAVRTAATTLINADVVIDATMASALKTMATTPRKAGDKVALAALRALADAFKVGASPDLNTPQRVVADLVEVAWSNLFMNYMTYYQDKV